jgi:hypothetical protein
MNLYLTLDAFPEVPDTLERLKKAGLRTTILSNGSPKMLEAAVKAAKRVCLCALSDGVPRRSLHLALVVGTVLNLINQGNALLGTASINWLKLIPTYCVPYAVCTYSAVPYQLRLPEPPLELQA